MLRADVNSLTPQTHWHPEVIPVVLLLLGTYFYCIGPLRVQKRLGPPVEPYRVMCALAAAFFVYIAEGTPVHSLSERYLFSVHMFQHIILMMVMPPLTLAAIPPWLARHWLRHPLVFSAVRWLTRPLIAYVAFNVTYAAWHVPYFYQAPLLFHWVHIVQHFTLIVTSFMMWWPLLSPLPELPRLRYSHQIAYIFALVVAQLPVFAPITFGTGPVYEFYARAPRIWGLSALEDQRWAGIIMKLGGMAILLAFAARAFFQWARAEGAVSSAPRPYPGRSGRYDVAHRQQ